jgi:hypothetical protein
MRVHVISFGSNWWGMHSPDSGDPYCFKRNSACFNAAALMCGKRLRHSAIYPGQIRFNSKSGFDPEFPSRAIGRTFLCSGPNHVAGRTHLLFSRMASETPPDAYLVTLNSDHHGSIRFDKPDWRSSGVRPISISLRYPRYEAMLLMGAVDWVQSDLGQWRLDPAGERLSLSGCREGAPQ